MAHHNLQNGDEIFARFSTWPKLLRVLSLVLRMRKTAQNGAPPDDPRIIYPAEIQHTRNVVIRAIQKANYNKEINALVHNGSLNPKSPLSPLTPYLDGEGMLRVGGRLDKAALTEDQKHPLIIPQGHVATLIARDAHEKTIHGGLQDTITWIRQKYWIIRVRNEVNK